jgi:hypothetical protein
MTDTKFELKIFVATLILKKNPKTFWCLKLFYNIYIYIYIYIYITIT